MEVTLKLNTLLFLMAMPVAVVIAGHFFGEKRNGRTALFGLFLLLFVGLLFQEIWRLEEWGYGQYDWLFFPFFPAVLLPLLFLSATSRGHFGLKKGLFVLGAEVSILAALYFGLNALKAGLWENTAFRFFSLTLPLLANLFFLRKIFQSNPAAFPHFKGTEESWAVLSKHARWLGTFYCIFLALLQMARGIPGSEAGKAFGAMAAIMAVFAAMYLLFRFDRVFQAMESIRPRKKSSPEEMASQVLGTNLVLHEQTEFGKVNQFMKEHQPHKNAELSLQALAAQMKMGQRKLSQTIKKATGMNFSRFVNSYRVIEAMELFNDPTKDNLSVTWIGYEAGFNSRTTFFNVFKETTGMPPAEYRKLRKSGEIQTETSP